MNKIQSLNQLYDFIPENQMIIVDVLRNLIVDFSKGYCKEKISYQVPYFFHNKGIAIVWLAAIPRGGIKAGVLFCIWYDNSLKSLQNYLVTGTNKQIYYKVIYTIEEINESKIKKLINEAIEIDKNWK